MGISGPKKSVRRLSPCAIPVGYAIAEDGELIRTQGSLLDRIGHAQDARTIHLNNQMLGPDYRHRRKPDEA
jgi:hypothetical protein